MDDVFERIMARAMSWLCFSVSVFVLSATYLMLFTDTFARCPQ